MALRTSQRILLAKAESSYGSDPTPGTSDAVLVRSIDITPLSATQVSRDLVRGYMGNYETILADTHVEVNFEVELAGSGTAGTPPRFSNLLLSCGTAITTVSSTSNTYAPISATFPSSTLWFYVDGQRHQVRGARGSFGISAEVGGIPVINFSFTGIYVAPGASSNPTPSYAAQATPVIFNKDNTTAFQLHSYAAALQSFNYDNANQVVYRELVQGTKEVLITERSPNGSVTIEAPGLGTKDYFAIANTSGSTGNLTFQHGQTTGNKVTLTLGQTDLQGPTYSDSEGVAMLNIGYTATPTTAGNNEFSLKFH
tara:strand:+ start:594 stop:1529 length:936 start_codon:yes stop_codon:yes gene_type:complete